MTSPTFSQFKVLVTRPENQQANVVRAIAEIGASSLSKPLIQINEVSSNKEIQLVKTKIQQLDNYHSLIFVSSNAASLGSKWIDRYWPQFPFNTKLIALGPTTAAVLKDALGCEVSIPSTGVTSEDVLKLPQLQALQNTKIAIFRGSGGRELLKNELVSRGAQVDYIEVYSRTPCSYNSIQLAEELRAFGTNVVSANSVETLVSFQKNLGSRFGEFSQLPVLVPSERVVKEAHTLGFSHAINCAGADSDALIVGLRLLADTVRENSTEET